MTLFGEVYFFIWLVILSIPAIVLGIKEKNIKYYGFFVTIVFIGFAIWGNPIGAIYLIGFCVYQLILTNVMLTLIGSKGRRKSIFWCFVILSALPLVIFKVSALFENAILGFIGISYLTFKSLQVIIEIYDQLIKEIKIFDYMYFLLFFPSISSGPIDRSRRFAQDIEKAKSKAEYLDGLGDGLMYICQGIVYKFVFAGLFYQAVNLTDNYSIWLASLGYMYCYGFYLFFDFAGYSRMAVGVSYIFAVNTPDNFNKPFISIDIKEFWDRWHISLSHWFRDFVFSRFMMASIRGKWFKDKLTGASIGFMINMLLMGLWHGLSLSYILYGLYHGILLAITEIYQKKSKFYKKHKKGRLYKFVSWFITFNLVMFGFYIFSGKFIEMI